MKKSKDTNNKKIRLPYGEGSIYYVDSRERYAGQITLIVDGEKIRKTVYGKSEKVVKDKLRELSIQAKAGNLHLPESKQKKPVKFYDYAERMIDNQLALNEIRQSTYDRKMATLKMLSELHDMVLAEITEDDIITFFSENLRYSQSCINKMYQLLGAVFQRAIRKKIIDSNPMEDLKRPKTKQKSIPVRALTIDEQVKLLNVLKTEDIHYSEIMLLSMFTGMRIGECCALTVEDIDFDDNTIHISKTVSRGEYGKTIICEAKTSAGMRTLYINDDVAEFLRECVGNKECGLLFKSSNDRLITSNQVNYVYANVLKNYGIVDNSVFGRVDLHSLRHTYATRCIESGMPAKVLQKVMGHTDINITLNTYCSVFEKYRNEHLAIADEYMRSNNLAIA